MTSLAAGGIVTTSNFEAFTVPVYVPRSGTCIRLPDGSHEWIIPLNPENRRRNLATLAEAARNLERGEGR